MVTSESPGSLRLTERAACAGCAGKLGPSELAQVLGGLPRPHDPRVLVDHSTGDDAGVFRVDERTTLVQTVDFFTPIVDDPEGYGAIAAANALSDVYAMGGRPLTALSIAAFPDADFPLEIARAIVRGGALKLQEAGCVLLGGHTVRDPELKFGYAVTGLVDPERMLTNAGGHPGDVLILTKPLGTGVIATALKAGEAPEAAVAASTLSMTTLNRAASEAAVRHGLRAATDITGFSLVGHSSGIARESALTLEIEATRLPLLPHALELVPRFQSKGLKANRRQFERLVEYHGTFDPALQALLFDPQTSGGLLLLAPPEVVPELLSELPGARVIGRALPKAETAISVRS
jgi:selenide, water dikinase